MGQICRNICTQYKSGRVRVKDFIILLTITVVCSVSTFYSEHVQTNVNDWNTQIWESRSSELIHDEAFQVLGYTVPPKGSQPMPDYWYLYWTFGKQFADIVLGQLGDLTYPSAFGACMGLIIIIRKQDEDYPKTALWGFIGISNAVGAFYVVLELWNMVAPPDRCGFGTGSFCHGEWSDLLAFAVPLISTLLWGSLFIFRHNRAPN